MWEGDKRTSKKCEHKWTESLSDSWSHKYSSIFKTGGLVSGLTVSKNLNLLHSTCITNTCERNISQSTVPSKIITLWQPFRNIHWLWIFRWWAWGIFQVALTPMAENEHMFVYASGQNECCEVLRVMWVFQVCPTYLTRARVYFMNYISLASQIEHNTILEMKKIHE